MPPAMDCESDLSEVEQQQDLLGEGAPGGRKGNALRKGVLAATVGAVLLGAAVLAVLYARPSATVGAPGAAGRTTADLIQGFALKQHGRPLTQEELTAVQGNLAKTRYGRLALPRLLEEDDEVSEDCKQMMKDICKEVFGKVMAATMAAVTPCNKDPSGQECEEAQDKVNHVEEEFTAGCKVTGDVCTVTDKFKSGEVIEERDVCMPKECHAYPIAAVAWAEDNIDGINPDEPGSMPEGSSKSVACGEGGTPEAESAEPDLEFLGAKETDGKVHPEVEVWFE